MATFISTKGPLVLAPARKAFVEPARLSLANPQRHLNACGPQRIGSMSGHIRIRIDRRRHHALEARPR